MKTTSEEFKLKAESSTGARYHLRIIANGQEITDDIDDFYYSIMGNDDDYFSIGNTASAIVNFSINEPSKDLENLELKISQGINIDGTIEYVDLGVFKVLKPTEDRNVYQYQCVDRMTYLMETEYSTTLTLPITDVAILQDVCSQVGITLVENGLISHEILVIPSGYTKREIIGYMAQLQGKNAIINSDGNLELVGYTETDYIIDDSKIYYDGIAELTSETDFVVNYVSCTVYDENEVKELVSGSGDMGIVLENPFMTQAILDEIYLKLKGFTFSTGTFKFLGDFRLELGDIVTVNTNGKEYVFPIMQIEHDSDGGVTTVITSIGQTATEDGIDSTSPTDRLIRRLSLQIIDSRKRISENTQSIIEQKTEITAVQGKITSKVWQQDITTALEELEVGAVNLLDGSKDLSDTNSFFAEYNLTDGANQLTYGGYALCI